MDTVANSAARLGATMVRDLAGDPGGSKPRGRVYQDGRVDWQCGKCGKFDAPVNLRMAPLTGNRWPIHPACYVEWYDGCEP